MNKRLLIALAASLVLHIALAALPYTAPEPGSPEPEEVVVQLTASTSERASPAPQEEESTDPKKTSDREVEEPQRVSEPVEETAVEAPVEEDKSEVEKAEEPKPKEESEAREPAPEGENNQEEPADLKREPMFRRASLEESYREPGGGQTNTPAVGKSKQEFEKYAVRTRQVRTLTEEVKGGTIPKNNRPSLKNTEINLEESETTYYLEEPRPETGQRNEESESTPVGVLPGERKLLENPLPEVPEWLEESGGGNVRLIIGYEVLPDGEISGIEILNSSGYPELNSLVIEHLSRWKYEPAGETERKTVEIQFKLDPEAPGKTDTGGNYAG